MDIVVDVLGDRELLDPYDIVDVADVLSLVFVFIPVGGARSLIVFGVAVGRVIVGDHMLDGTIARGVAHQAKVGIELEVRAGISFGNGSACTGNLVGLDASYGQREDHQGQVAFGSDVFALAIALGDR